MSRVKHLSTPLVLRRKGEDVTLSQWLGDIARATKSSAYKNWASFESGWRRCLDPTWISFTNRRTTRVSTPYDCRLRLWFRNWFRRGRNWGSVDREDCERVGGDFVAACHCFGRT